MLTTCHPNLNLVIPDLIWDPLLTMLFVFPRLHPSLKTRDSLLKRRSRFKCEDIGVY